VVDAVAAPIPAAVIQFPFLAAGYLEGGDGFERHLKAAERIPPRGDVEQPLPDGRPCLRIDDEGGRLDLDDLPPDRVLPYARRLYSDPLSGFERMRALSDGLLPWPPLSRLTGMHMSHVDAGATTWTLPA
jgi:hypothetical protein